jgi:hypothetical protein
MITMPKRRMIAFFVGFFAAGFLTGTGATAEVASADPSTPDLVCAASRYGQTPGQIVTQIQQGNPRLASPYLPYQVFQDLNNCDD